MGLARILVDGYSLLHGWPELAPRAARHSAAARDELIQTLTRYQDAIGTPITVVFDGSGAPPGTPRHPTAHSVEVLYSRAGQTADELIERAAYRLLQYGGVLVVTDDYAERDLVAGFGASVASCDHFIGDIGRELGELDRAVRAHNRREETRYRQRS